MASLPVAGVDLGVGAAYPGVVGGVDSWNAAGIGAAGLNRSRSTTTPYNAFTGPPGGGYEPMPPPMPVAHSVNADLLHDAAGIPVSGVYSPMPQPQPYVPDGVKEDGILTAAGLGGAAGAAAVTTARDQGSVHSRTRGKSGKPSGNRSGSGNGMSQGSSTASSEQDKSSMYNLYEYSAYPPANVAHQRQSQQQKGVGARPLSTMTSLGGEDPDHNEEDEDESDKDDNNYRMGGGGC
ncbi:hypothetical protein BDY19DRAFT_998223 [Irpex rosettiformis]|uniref:Uncharacterized protein n=1 Tax=Irpex rosettiformis TaxID=378272 RepID=A0ACB8TPW2_9APHY|nr:hypothetical protein BDY19DRAFT_998223 [Irpex rosettiformis]